jgi:hypothetical protein
MNKYYRIIIVRFDYLYGKCLFPIILNWSETNQAAYEMEILEKIIAELETALGITKVRVLHNRVGTYEDLNQEFNDVIADINFNSAESKISTLSIDLKRFLPLTDADIQSGTVEKFQLHRMHFPVKVIDPTNLNAALLQPLPMLVIEE